MNDECLMGLGRGDEVMYRDPFEGPRVVEIVTIEIYDELVCIDTTEGEHIECRSSELS